MAVIEGSEPVTSFGREEETKANLQLSEDIPRLWQVWLVVSFLLILLAYRNVATFSAQDPDDYMRLLQVRDWLSGQAWFDSRQYRMNAPVGADMHWVRIVDLPIAIVMWPLRELLPQRLAETAAMTIVPLSQLLVAMMLLRRLLRALGGSEPMAIAAAAMVPLFPLLATNFFPMRIDHHGWQAVSALAVAWLIIRGDTKSSFIAGLITSAWLLVSLEGMPLAAVFGALLALRYCLQANRGHEAFLAGLSIGGLALSLLMRAPGEYALAYCDMMTWPHLLAFGSGTILAAMSRFMPGQEHPLGRSLSLLPILLVTVAAIVFPLGRCAISPLIGLDPLLRQVWFENMAEAAPLGSQTASVAAMLVWTVVIVAAGAFLAIRHAEDDRTRANWAILMVAALAACGTSFFAMRAGLTAQLLAIPFAVVIVWQYMPRARSLKPIVPRVLATVGCLGLATPVLPSAAFKGIDRSDAYNVVSIARPGSGSCEYDRLNLLPPSRLFASLDRGPEILARSQHSVVMSGYHRNQAKMLDVLLGFGGPLDRAHAIITANRSEYVVGCISSADLTVAANMSQDNLAKRMLSNKPPEWLEPVSFFSEGPMRVWRVHYRLKQP